MPTAPGKPCPGYGSRRNRCPCVINRGDKCCPVCMPAYEAKRREGYRDYNKKRDPKVIIWMNSRRYETLRRVHLRAYPLCVECVKDGIDRSGNIVDHVEAHKGQYERFWNTDNWQTLCKHHHDIKTAKEDGGFGNR